MSTSPALSDGGPYLSPTRNPFNYSKFEQINRDNVTPWLTLDEITQQINLFEDESQDVYLKSLELATRQAIEDYLGLPIMPVTYRVYYNGNALWGVPLSLDLPEISPGTVSGSTYAAYQNGIRVDSLGYWNASTPSVFVPVASTDYSYDNSGNKVILANLPTDLNYFMTAPIVLTYTIAASPLGAYPVIKQAGLLLFTHLYNNRSNTVDTPLREIPYGVSALLRPYKPLVM
jgi:hypothetical protein